MLNASPSVPGLQRDSSLTPTAAQELADCGCDSSELPDKQRFKVICIGPDARCIMRAGREVYDV